MHSNYIILGSVLLVLILLTVMSSSSYVPYRPTSAYLNEYTYEGMEGDEGMKEEEGMKDEEGMKEEEGMEGEEGMKDDEGMVAPLTQEGFSLSADEAKVFNEYKAAKTKYESMKTEWEKIVNNAKSNTEGFTGMTGSVYNTNTYILDQFSSAVGDVSCAGKSSGLSNSTGPLCLSEDQKRLLQTRGGNATGGGSKV